MTVKDQIKSVVTKVVADKSLEFSIEVPNEKKHGDYATNVAMPLAKKAKKPPITLAGEFKLKLEKSELFDKVEIVEPGFINFFLKPKFLQSQVKEIIGKKQKFGEVDIGKSKKIQVEFVSANPTGPLTVANARGGPMGDVLANILAKAGYKTEKEFYVNDSGNQILSLGNSILGKKEGQYKGKYINDLRRRISVKGREKDPYKAGRKAAKIIVNEMIKKTTDNLGIKYDKWFFESDLSKSVKADKLLESLKRKKLIYKKDDAIWFKSSKFGDRRDRVLIKSDGWETYLAGDIVYHYNKFKERKFDKVINIWGADHHGDIPGLLAGVEAIGCKGKLDILIYQFINILEKGKKIRMSKRQGTFIAMDELLKEVGSDVVRFFFLMYSANRHMDFDLALAKEKSEKNPVFYVQYAYARINSILKKSKNQKPNIKSLSLLVHPSELELIKELIKLPEIVEDTVKDYQVQRLPHYAMDVAAVFHRFYTDCKVLGDYKALENARLALVWATKIVLENVLDLMGVTKPEKM
jgi:arginyl-tRNA synthetase